MHQVGKCTQRDAAKFILQGMTNPDCGPGVPQIWQKPLWVAMVGKYGSREGALHAFVQAKDVLAARGLPETTADVFAIALEAPPKLVRHIIAMEAKGLAPREVAGHLRMN